MSKSRLLELDTHAYRTLYADVAALSDDAVAVHYQQFGRREGRSPVALFDPRFYATGAGLALADALDNYENNDFPLADPHPLFDLAFYRAQAGDTPDPVAHYMTEGWKQGLDPHPLFSTRYYIEQFGAASFSNGDPLSDFVLDGWRRARRPNPLFDVEFYLSHNRDVAEAGTDPLSHYASAGWREGRAPHELFDVMYYRSQLTTDAEPLAHYLHGGTEEGLDPHPLFSTDYYRVRSPDIDTASINPLVHFASFGGRELRQHHPLFEPAWYAQRTNCDGIPVIHYLDTKGRHDPSPIFNTNWYLRHNEPARQSGDAPLVHWVVNDARFGRPFSSLPVEEAAMDMLRRGEISAAAGLMRQSRSEVNGSLVVIPFEVDSPAGHIDAGYAFSVLPGAISDDGRLVGGLPVERPTISTVAGASAIIRSTGGIATGRVAPATLEGAAMAAQSHQASDWEWYLRCLPALVEAARSSNLSNVIIPFGRSQLEVTITRFVLPGVTVTEIEPGAAFRLRDCTVIAQRSPSPRSPSSHPVTSDGPLLVLDGNDPFDGRGRAALVDAVLSAGGVVVDTSWGPEVLAEAITRSNRIISAGAIPCVAFFACASSTLVALVDDLPQELDILADIDLQVERIRLPVIGEPTDQHHRPNLDPSTRLSEIIGNQ